DRAAREDEAHPGEPRRHDEDHQGAEEDELVPDAEAHATARTSTERDDQVLLAAAVATAPRTHDVLGEHARDGSTPPNPRQRTGQESGPGQDGRESLDRLVRLDIQRRTRPCGVPE